MISATTARPRPHHDIEPAGPTTAPSAGGRATAGLVAAAAVAGLVVRLWPRGALWLDEAQSVSIARLPLHEMVGALRADGAPPLYYLILHGWTAVFGYSDVAVRMLSVLLSIAFAATLVIATLRFATRRAAACVLVLVATNTFAVRYAAEGRMYCLVMLEVALGLLAVDALLARPTWPRAGAVAVIAGSLPYTHYWGLYLLVVTGAVLAAAAVIGSSRDVRRPIRLTLLAVIVGGALWIPWLPVFRFQSKRTATPWTRPGTLRSIPSASFRWDHARLGGAVLFASLAVAVAIAVTPWARSQWRSQRMSRDAIALVGLGTLVIAALGGSLSGSAYAGRYTSVFFPLAVLLAGVGLAALPTRRTGAILVAVLAGAGLFWSVKEIRRPRTRAATIAAVLVPLVRPGDVVVYCPDQLGPATSRVLDRSPVMSTVTQLSYPAVSTPGLVNWVDYADRYRDADPNWFVAGVNTRAPDGAAWLVWSDTYPVTQRACVRLFDSLRTSRPLATNLVPDDPQIADHGALWRFAPRAEQSLRR